MKTQKFAVICTVPTAHQYESCKFFGAPKKQGDGSYQVYEVFDTEEEAKQYLHHRIDIYCEVDGTEEEINEMRECVENHNYLEYDAAYARVKAIEIEKFARRCDVTGRGMNEGWVWGDGDYYTSTEQITIAKLRANIKDGIYDFDEQLSDDELLQCAYDEGVLYYTEWEIDADEWYDEDGNEHND